MICLSLIIIPEEWEGCIGDLEESFSPKNDRKSIVQGITISNKMVLKIV